MRAAWNWRSAVAAAGFALISTSAYAAPIFVAGPSPVAPFAGTVIDFEGLAEGQIIDNEFAGLGVTFTQTGGGSPMVDNMPALFGYGTGSGTGMLTGSGNAQHLGTTNGIIATFAAGQTNVGAFMSDPAPLGNYTITAYGAGNVFLESFVVTPAQFPGVVTCGSVFPAAPGCGVFVGFSRAGGDIFAVQFGPSGSFGDAFSIDDVRFGTAAAPEPASLVLLGLGVVGLVARRRRL
jgi:hypothetical protein